MDGGPWTAAKRTEAQYYRKLRRIAESIRQIVEGYPEAGMDPAQTDALEKTLNAYSDTLGDWADREAARIVAEVSNRNERAWILTSNRLGRGLRDLLNTTPTGTIIRERSVENAALIKSLPSEAAKKVREYTIEGLSAGERASSIAEKIQALGGVTKNRAKLIARTEVARTASLLTQARAERIGCTHYIWRTSRDAAVRKSHREMEGIVCEWANPPTLSDGTTTHAGQIYNCRCYPEPIIPDEIYGGKYAT